MKKLKMFMSFLVVLGINAKATNLEYVKIVNDQTIVVCFIDGETWYQDDAKGPSAYYGHGGPWPDNGMTYYGSALNTANAQDNANWFISSTDDGNYEEGKNPTDIFRKSKVWGSTNTISGTPNKHALKHKLFLVLPNALQQGKTYSININSNTNADSTN
ncbi:MAG: hypothetical protein K9G70_10290 [Prolixibacteraceae bacterium]|nr:hypothetical protein [Prolixibacteraceae bacterium]